MKKLLIILVAVLVSTSSFAGKGSGSKGGHVHVSGYTKRDGTYVQPHHRTSPDGTKLNNWSHYGNVNPYTGKVGTNTDSSTNYRGGYVGYAQPHYQTHIGNHYIMQHQELHNTKLAKDYID